MNTEDSDLKQQLIMISIELAQTRIQLQSLHNRHRRGARSIALFRLTSLIVLMLFIGVPLRSKSVTQNVPQPNAVSLLQAPVLVKDRNGQTLLEISDQPGHKGLTIYSSAGEAVYLGFDKEQNGLVSLGGPGRKIFADVSLDGFKYFGPSGQSVAFLGADSASHGAFQLKSSTGGVVVEALAVDANTGIVQVYPRSGNAPFPVPNYIRGSK